MSNKTSFKRIALAVVVALGFGVLATGSSSAAIIDESFTISAATASVKVGETASATVTLSYVGLEDDTSNVVIAGTGAGGTPYLQYTTDSVNAKSAMTGNNTATLSKIGPDGDNKFVKVVANVYIADVANIGTHVYTITSRNHGTGTTRKAVTFTVTVAANPASVATAANSKMWIQDRMYSTLKSADSTLVVSAGAAATPAVAGIAHFRFQNSSDTTTGVSQSQTVNLVVTGPGLVSDSSGATKGKQATINAGETAVVWSDGTPGTGTITAYLGSVSTANKFAQAAKSVVFSGPAVSFTPTWESMGSLAAGATATGAISFVAKDAAGNAVIDANLNLPNQAFYLVSSDTKVVGTATQIWEACSYSSARSKWLCDVKAVDSGTATLVIADSKTVASSTVKSADLAVTVAGAAYTGTIAFNKASYAPGELMILTLTAKDGGGRDAVDGARDVFSSEKWANGNAPAFGSAGAFTNLIDYLTSGTSFVAGIDTAVAYAPTTAGSWSLTGVTSGTTTDSKTVSLAFTVIDPAEEAANSALDAAQEATDAAIAATDAAILAQEAADEAASAAIAAQETAQAAVDAVTALSAEVTKLVAQLATLQKLLNRVAKRVGVKL